ncbi:hypothetical protein ACFFK0_01970 [Paenibacillus chartarius]|uniref:NIPSNAP domain-containing protein n=1 Tax=Paenibacillus chartarius TaxID=747481 RepID=A0ABV6DEZ6_9BACL
MEKVFVEYAIAEEARNEYLAFMSGILGGLASGAGVLKPEWYEGTDQPGLFVEVWPGMNYADFLKWKERRTNCGDAEWGRFDRWVRGGLQKLHIWHFSVPALEPRS